MRWPWRERREPRPSDEAVAAESHADRVLLDVANLGKRADKAAERAAEIKRVNHIAIAVAKSIRGV